MPSKDIAGIRYGRLLAVRPTGQKRHSSTVWLCLCDCGKYHEVVLNSLNMGRAKSCGCLAKEVATRARLKHGYFGTPTYQSWASMVQRCTNPSASNYQTYGGQGVSVCESWRDFRQFLEDMGERPDGKTLDRVRSELGYSKANCRWADSTVQARNRRKASPLFATAELVRESYRAGQGPKAIAESLGLSLGVVTGILYQGTVACPSDLDFEADAAASAASRAE